MAHFVTLFLKGTGSFVLNVPLPSSSFNSGSGSYVLTAAVTNANGVSRSYSAFISDIKTDPVTTCPF